MPLDHGAGPFDKIDTSGIPAGEQRQANWLTDLYKEMYGPSENSPVGFPGGIAGACYARAWAGSPETTDDQNPDTAQTTSQPDVTDDLMNTALNNMLKLVG